MLFFLLVALTQLLFTFELSASSVSVSDSTISKVSESTIASTLIYENFLREKYADWRSDDEDDLGFSEMELAMMFCYNDTVQRGDQISVGVYEWRNISQEQRVREVQALIAARFEEFFKQQKGEENFSNPKNIESWLNQVEIPAWAQRKRRVF